MCLGTSMNFLLLISILPFWFKVWVTIVDRRFLLLLFLAVWILLALEAVSAALTQCGTSHPDIIVFI